MNYESIFRAVSFSPEMLSEPSAWLGHLPFAGWVILNLKPNIFVELGSHAGHSYFAFCQAVNESGLHTKCFGIDTWLGDGITTGYYDNDVYTKVHAHNNERYSAFSKLLRMTFDEALSNFEDGSIDLLHIDGLHTYEAVCHDFETWLPKLAPGAVVMFHDTMIRAENFGVWKFWQELTERYPMNLEFEHSCGLGVLQLNNCPSDKQAEWLKPGFANKQIFIEYFCVLGNRQFDRYRLTQTQEDVLQLQRIVNEGSSDTTNAKPSAGNLHIGGRIKSYKTFLFYEDFLSLMSDDVRTANGLLKINGVSYNEYNEKIEILANSRSIYSFYFGEAGKSVLREQSESKWVEPRVQAYQKWLAKLVHLISLPNFRVAIEFEDMATGDVDIPILSFHKKAGQNYVLIPDFEIYELNYYRNDKYLDNFSFQEKVDKAVFVGSTTGTNKNEDRNYCNTKQNIQFDPSVRISAAKYFEENASVFFKLPSIVQCDSADTEQYLRTLPFTQCDYMDWKEQFKYKFIISIDGNGPTCSRVAVTLLSNSVLLKYDSKWITYYHRAMRPFVDYVPVSSHEDINHTLDEIKPNYSFYSYVSLNASERFSLLFKKANVDRFYGVVLNEVYSLFFGRNATYWENRFKLDKVTHLDIEAHFANSGDIWLYPSLTIKDRAENFIQGITISPASDLFEWYDITYQVMFEDGSVSDMVFGGQFSGTKGQNKNITGFKMIARSRAEFFLSYIAIFADDESRKVSMGEWLHCDNQFIKCIVFHLDAY